MTEALETSINDYVTQFLLRYFRNAIAMAVDRPRIDTARDIDLLRLHWAFAEPVKNLIAHLCENPHEVQAVLQSGLREDDARVRGRFDARATTIRHMVTGHPTLMVSHEPLRRYDSGPNHVLTWVLEQAWRLSLHFKDRLPEGASYLRAIEACAPGLEKIRRFEAIHNAVKQLNLTRRPSHQAVKEASRSRRLIYILASKAYRALQAIEAGEEESIRKLLKETLLGPLPVWQRFELAVGLGLAQALSETLGQRLSLRFLAGGREPVARVGNYEVYWQSTTDFWKTPAAEPSEKLVSGLLKQYGLSEGSDRPDLVVLDVTTDDIVAVIEAKCFSKEEGDSSSALRAAITQLVRYARGYRDLEDLDGLLDNSIVALIHDDFGQMLSPRPYGLPLVVDFEGIIGRRLEEWSLHLISYRTEQARGFGGSQYMMCGPPH